MNDDREGKFIYPHCPCLSDETSYWSRLSVVYARGSKTSHTEGKCVAYLGLHILDDNSEINHTCQAVVALDWAAWSTYI